MYCKAFVSSWGGTVKTHGTKPRMSSPHVFVANHTSVIDYIILSADQFPHATVAQTHGGLIGYFEHSVLTLNGSLMFNRSEKNDRTLLAKKMKNHVLDPSKSPLLIFPEGTCVNNEYTVLFHKGAFDLGVTVAPVAIKYDKSWADAYWHSKTQSFTVHLLYLMTRWALVADVWYLEPRKRREGQTTVEFANEVKAEISKIARLKNLSWDGYFKNYAPPVEKRARLKENPQTRYGALLKNRIKNQTTGVNGASGRVGRVRRSSCGGAEFIGNNPTTASSRRRSYHLDYGMNDVFSTDSKNRVLVALNDSERRQDMIHVIADRRNDVVDTWKEYTKLRMDDHKLRRVENSSWRLWFKQRIEARNEEEAVFTYRNEEYDDAVRRKRHLLTGSTASVLEVFSSYLSSGVFSSDFALPKPNETAEEETRYVRRVRSVGSAMSQLSNDTATKSRKQTGINKPSNITMFAGSIRQKLANHADDPWPDSIECRS